MKSPWLWYISRADGVITLILLTTVAVLGVLTAARWQPHSQLSAIVMGIHRTLALGTTAFLAGHILTAVLDTYVHLGWLSALVPFTSGYERVWVGLGAIACDIFLAIIATSLLRQRLPMRVWRGVHRMSHVMAALAITHALVMATSTAPILFAITVACGVVLTAATLWRCARSLAGRGRLLRVAPREWS